ncbi:MAG: adenylate/guanylate cyclase domain-containing protein [Thermodesulfobacteriota bacterium]
MTDVSVVHEGNVDNLRRKLAAIMFTDIYRYSRLMSTDEQKAIQMLAEHDRITEKVISSFQGRILKRMGDAVFAEFSSSADALQCAIRIQEELKAYNEGKGEHERILIRIGLHEGDVIVRGDDLFGEGVNVAARLEPLADPGGICISEALYQSVRNTTKVEAMKVGEVELKNILQKYTIYKIPSSYPHDPGLERGKPVHQEARQGYRIRKIADLPVKYLSPLEMTISSILFCALCIVLFSYASAGSMGLGYLLPFVLENKFSIAVLTLLLILMAVYFYSMRSVRITFDDIRAVDRLLDFLASQIGYTRQISEHNTVILKPSLYHFIMYSARRIKAVFDGNAVVLTGNFMYIRKLLKVIRSFETAG